MDGTLSQMTRDKSSRAWNSGATIQALLRHGSFAVTQVHYIKALPAASIEAMQKLAQNVGQQMGTEKILVNA